MTVQKVLKYPLYLFIALFIAKVGYIVIESFYNYHVLFTTTSVDIISKEVLEQLNKNGHLISSSGITLLLIPFLYLAVKRITNKEVMYTIFTISSIITFFFSYIMLNKAIDYIVEKNQDKRHDAYYVDLFKFGLLKKHFDYDSFIKIDNIKNEKLTINDRILLTNSFLLLQADEKLIDKLKKRGYERAPEIYIEKNIDDFNNEFNKFDTLAQEIISGYTKFNDEKKILQNNINNIDKLGDNKEISKHYNELISKIKENYEIYKKSKAKAEKIIKQETSYEKINDIYKKLQYYFNNRNKSSVQKKYDSMMIEKFGKNIDPNRWLDNYERLSMYQIKKVITEEVTSDIPKIGNSERLLSFDEFKNTQKVRDNIYNKLKSEGIIISKQNFDYSKSQFTISYNNMLTTKKNKLYEMFTNGLNKSFGKNDLNTKTTWNEFLYSNYLKNKIKSELKITNEKDFNIVIEIIKSDNRKESFKNLLYIPKVKTEIDKLFFTKEQFNKDKLAIKVGNEAIKLLYIPPFALAISILALLLNIITVVGLFLELKKVSSLIVWVVKISLLIGICLLPVISNYDGLDNELIRKEANIEMNNYLNFLNWLSYYEKFNIKLHD